MPRKPLDPQRPVILPWRIVVDSAETQPWTFTGIKASPAKGRRPIIVETVTRCLGRHPDSYGDYTLETVDGRHSALDWCAIERKSLADFQDTLLNFTDDRHARFEQEMRNYRAMIITGGCACVIVEANFDTAIEQAPAFGTKTDVQNARSILGTILAMSQDYGVPWLPMGNRRLAELAAFQYLQRFWKHHKALIVPSDERA